MMITGPILRLSTDTTGQVVAMAAQALLAAGDKPAAQALIDLWRAELARQPLIGLVHAIGIGHLERLSRQGLNVGPETLDQI